MEAPRCGIVNTPVASISSSLRKSVAYAATLPSVRALIISPVLTSSPLAKLSIHTVFFILAIVANVVALRG